MTVGITCPSCGSANDAEETRCQDCGSDLSEARRSLPSEGPIQLQRVLGSEVYRVDVLESSPPARRAPEPTRDPPETETATGADEGPRSLTELAERIAERASASGQRFKRYTANRPRHAETDGAKAALKKQLDSAARAFRERRFDAAIEHLLKAIAKEDTDPRSWILLGEAYLRVERPYKAAVGYLRALELDPLNDNAWLGLARALRAMEDFAAALEILDRTVQTNPALTEAWSERGIVLEGLDRSGDAAKSFQKALELRPDHRTARERYERLAPRRAEPLAGSERGPGGVEAPAAGSPQAAASAPEDEEFPDFADLAPTPPGEAESVRTPAVRPARVRTFIGGLDDSLGGGIPWGHVVLLEGPAGAMKSSVGFSVLAQNAAQDGLHGLYLSLRERTSSLLKQMGSLGLPLHVDRGSVVVMDPRAVKNLLSQGKDWIESLQGALDAIKAQRGLDLLVLDSLEALEVLGGFADRRREVFRLFDWLHDLDVTSFVVSERADELAGGRGAPVHRDEDFLADGVVRLEQHVVSEQDMQRRLRIVKMRGTAHETSFRFLGLEDGRFRIARKPA